MHVIKLCNMETNLNGANPITYLFLSISNFKQKTSKMVIIIDTINMNNIIPNVDIDQPKVLKKVIFI